MTSDLMDRDTLVLENAELRRRLEEVEDTLSAIQAGEVDAFFVQGERNEVLTLESPDRPYRLLVEQMQQGGATLTSEGRILYCNWRFAALLKRPVQSLVGRPLREFMASAEQRHFDDLLAKARDGGELKAEVSLQRADSEPSPVYFSIECVHEGALGHCLFVADLT